MSRSTDSQNITAVPATNLPDEEIDTPKLQLSPIKKIALTVFHN